MSSSLLKNIEYVELEVVKVIKQIKDEKTRDIVWTQLTNHHALPVVKEGKYVLNQFWLAYSSDPCENLQICKEEYGDSWKNEGLLGKVVADYILKERPDFKDWESVLLYVTW